MPIPGPITLEEKIGLSHCPPLYQQGQWLMVPLEPWKVKKRQSPNRKKDGAHRNNGSHCFNPITVICTGPTHTLISLVFKIISMRTVITILSRIESQRYSGTCFFCALFFSFFLIYLFLCIYFWLYWVFVAARGLSLVAASRGYSLLRCSGFSLWWLLLLQSMGSRHAGFSVVARGLSSCGSWALERRLSSCGTRA